MQTHLVLAFLKSELNWLDDAASLCSEGSGAKYRKYSGVSLTGNFELCIGVNVGASGCLSLCRPATDW